MQAMSLLTLPISNPASRSSDGPSTWRGRHPLAGKLRPPPLRDERSRFSIVCLRGADTSTFNAGTLKTEGPTVNRSSFPPGFTFGAASSAYQIEGGWNEGGKGPSIWDTFTHNYSDRIDDFSNGDNATNAYRLYKEDVKHLKDMGMDAYRFSIAWSRILPKGSLEGGINRDGINYYNNLINELVENGIQPYVTLFHWDVPQALEDKYNGFLDKDGSGQIIEDFKDYCDICFKEFGDRVKHWITLNEPWTFSTMGYGLGSHAPGRCSDGVNPSYKYRAGNSLEEPYIVTHNLILAHAKAAKHYKENYQAKQNGQIGITLICMWYTPYDPSHRDTEATNRLLDFMLAWYMEPLVHGEYPFNMRAIVRNRLPAFTEEQSKMVKDSYDFIGLNYYTARYVQGLGFTDESNIKINVQESFALMSDNKNGKLIGENYGGSWINVYPRGIKDLLLYVRWRFNNPPIYITENGINKVEHAKSTMEEELNDERRVDYYSHHLTELRDAIRDGSNVKGYFAWSLTDNFEWNKGYTERFGLIYVDYKDFKRYPKASAKWFTEFLKPT